jgi:hypothetical protein
MKGRMLTSTTARSMASNKVRFQGRFQKKKVQKGNRKRWKQNEEMFLCLC